MRRLAALAVLAIIVAGCGREHPSALSIQECLRAHGATDIHLVYLHAAPLGVRDDWTGVEDITFAVRLTRRQVNGLAPLPVSAGGVILLARSETDASRIRRELRELGAVFGRRRAALAFPNDAFEARCL